MPLLILLGLGVNSTRKNINPVSIGVLIPTCIKLKNGLTPDKLGISLRDCNGVNLPTPMQLNISQHNPNHTLLICEFQRSKSDLLLSTIPADRYLQLEDYQCVVR